MIQPPKDAAARRAIKPVICYPVETLPQPDMATYEAARGDVSKVSEVAEGPMRDAYKIRDKQERTSAISAARDTVKAGLSDDELADKQLSTCFKKLESSILRGDVIKTGERIDGRNTTTVRPIVAEVGMLPRTHGSSLFTHADVSKRQQRDVLSAIERALA